MGGKFSKLDPHLDAEVKREREALLGNRDKHPNQVLSGLEPESTSTSPPTPPKSWLLRLLQGAYNWKFSIFILLCVIAVLLYFTITVWIPAKNKENEEKAIKKTQDETIAKLLAVQKEKDKQYSKLSATEIKKLEWEDYNSKKSRVILFQKVDYNNLIDDTYNKINYKINTEKSLTTDIVIEGGLGTRSIAISNCKVKLKNVNNGNTVEYKHFMVEPDNWFKTNLTDKYDNVKINIMSEIILYEYVGVNKENNEYVYKVIENDKIFKIDINNLTELPDISFSAFKIRNCSITVYPSPKYKDLGTTFDHSSRKDDANDDSKCYLYKSFGNTVFKSITIVPIK